MCLSILILVVLAKLCLSGDTWYVHLIVSDGVCSSKDVEYFLLYDRCIPSLSLGARKVERYTLNQTTGNLTRYFSSSLQDCEDGKYSDIFSYVLNECFEGFSQDTIKNKTLVSQLFYRINVTNEFPFNGTNSKKWTKVSFFSDDVCEEALPINELSTHQYFRDDYALYTVGEHRYDAIRYYTFYNCHNDDMILSLTLGGTSKERWGYIFYGNLGNNECSTRIDKSFLHLHDELKTFRKECLTSEEFNNSAVLEFDCGNYLIEKIHYGYDESSNDCYGTSFVNARTPLKQCYRSTKTYVNETLYLDIIYEDQKCEGSPIYVRYGRPFFDGCRDFRDIVDSIETAWGYEFILEDDPDFSQELAAILVANCSEFGEEKMLQMKHNISKHHAAYFISENACIRPGEWGPLFYLGEGMDAISGKCVDGKVSLNNYIWAEYSDYRCENEYNHITEGFCVDGPFYSIYMTCIPFFCYEKTQYDENVCSGHGKCMGTDKCVCSKTDLVTVDGKILEKYYGEKCQYERDEKISSGIEGSGFKYLWAVITFPTLGLLISLFFCVLATCCLCCFSFLGILCCITLLPCLSVLVGSLIFLRIRLKRFSKLRNVELLIKEQELEDDHTVAHFVVNPHLFKIDFKSISIVKMLGEGGSNSVVYLAEWKNSQVAFKCFKTKYICNAKSTFEEFEREVSVMSSISHPNILRFFGCTMLEPRVGIVMEYCSNGDLEQFIKKFREKNDGRRYHFEEKYRILLECISALDYLHTRNVIHRDIKLQNVLLDSQEHAKLMDFGLSRHVDKTDSNKTTRIGTSIYMSPEICTDSKYNEKTDVFSFAIMIWVFITENNNPYGSMDAIELKVASNPNFRPDISLLESWLPGGYQWISNLTQECWNHTPDVRKSFGEMNTIFLEQKEKVKNGEIVVKNDAEGEGNYMETKSSEKEMEGSVGGDKEEKVFVEKTYLDSLEDGMRKRKNEIESLKEKIVELEGNL